VPGVDTEWEGAKLANRIACRQTLIVDEVAQRIDLRGKRVLELACNCGYWSARYAERGAAWVLGVEGRPQYVQQAELYWRTNRFLDAGRYQFIEGNIAKDETWRKIQAMGPFDVTICAGILYHIKDYRAVLNWIGHVTTEAVVVDTRVGDEHEQVVREPGDLKFNAIQQTLDKVVPHLPKLLSGMQAAGFDPMVLPVSFAAAPGLTSGDDYTTQRRVTILGTCRTTAAVKPEPDQSADQPVRLHLGCGPERRAGWVNVDANAEVEPDVVSVAEDLPMFDDDSVDAIEACHLFEHFTFDQARAALREWHRVLKPDGMLHLELPNLAACIDMIGEHEDPQGYDLGMIGLYGYPPAIAAEGAFQIHKWGWTPQTLGEQLRAAGFDDVRVEPITQTWRRAAKVGRGMRLTARKAIAAPAGV
jgi:ubiquinone/menaquinone biosynthesis C-methylase UbiE